MAAYLFNRKRQYSIIVLAALGIGAWIAVAIGAPKSNAEIGVPAPEFTHSAAGAWVNSPPLTLAGLRGTVLLVDF